MRLVSDRKMNGVAAEELTLGAPCYTSLVDGTVYVYQYSIAPSSETDEVVLVDYIDTDRAADIPSDGTIASPTIAAGSDIIFANEGEYEYNSDSAISSIYSNMPLEWTATGVQALSSGQRAGYVLNKSGQTYKIVFDGNKR